MRESRWRRGYRPGERIEVESGSSKTRWRAAQTDAYRYVCPWATEEDASPPKIISERLKSGFEIGYQILGGGCTATEALTWFRRNQPLHP